MKRRLLCELINLHGQASFFMKFNQSADPFSVTPTPG
jgi:hypothetical protein